MLRSYNAFMSKSYKVAIYILYPLLACLGCILVQSGCFGLISKSGYNCMVAECLLCYGIVLIEFIVDIYLYSGIWSKSSYMDFFHSSHKGKQLLKDALLFSLIRRILMIMLCSAFNIVFGLLFFEHNLPLGECIRQAILYAIGCYFFSTLFVFLYRLVDVRRRSAICGYLGSMILGGFFYLFSVLKFSFWTWLVILLAASIILTMKVVKVEGKKVEDSYYDERS